MSANWEDSDVSEQLNFRAEDKIKGHITEFVNDCYCHVMSWYRKSLEMLILGI